MRFAPAWAAPSYGSAALASTIHDRKISKAHPVEEGKPQRYALPLRRTQFAFDGSRTMPLARTDSSPSRCVAVCEISA